MSASRFEALLEVSDMIACARDLKELLRQLAPALKKVVDFDYVAVFLYDSQKNLMTLHVLEKFFDWEPPSIPMPPERTPAGRCFLTQKEFVIYDTHSETRFDDEVIGLMRQYGFRSVCYQPLTTPVRQLGVISFGSLQPHKFELSEMPFMLKIANQVALALDNALHFDEAQRYQRNLAKERDRLRILLDLNNAIASRRAARLPGNRVEISPGNPSARTDLRLPV